MEFADYVLDKKRGITDMSTKGNIISYTNYLKGKYPNEEEFYKDITEKDYRVVVDQILKNDNRKTTACNRRKYYYAVRKVLEFMQYEGEVQ